MSRRIVAAFFLAIVLANGCVVENPVQRDVVEDLNEDFEQNDYFNP